MAELKPEKLIDLGEKAVNAAVNKGADEAEAFLSEKLQISVDIERGQIAKNVRKSGQGLGIRVICKKAVGFSYTNMLDEASVVKTAIEAFQSAKGSKADENWSAFPAPRKYATTKGTYDGNLANISSDDLVDMASEMLNEATTYDKRVFPAFGNVETELLTKAVVNSHGLGAFDKGTSIGCYLGTVARQANDVTPMCVEFNVERTLNVDPRWVGIEAAKRAVSALEAQKIASGDHTVVFSQQALYGLLYYTFISSVKADRVQRDQSALKGKIGKKIASDVVTIYDDGLMPNGLETWKFDDEGVPRRRTPIVEKGVLRQYLYDNYTAGKEGIESTGNALRQFFGSTSYSATPIIEATNFTINPGNKSPETLIEEVDNGIIVYSLQGAHSSNPSTGEFSVVATPAWKIEHGEIAYAVKAAMLTGTVFDVLNNVSALGNNPRKIYQIFTPWLRAENIKVVGK